jgi:N-acetylglucosaminyl-diphospho-decaprenol L-rhamnosyltransferase
MTLTIIIVSWNVRQLLANCIRSLHTSLAGSLLNYQIVVVDNASHDGTPAMLRSEFPEVVLLESGGNLGFAGGNNLGIRWALGQGSEVALTPSPSPTTGRREPIEKIRDQETEARGFQPTLRAAEPPEYLLILNPDTEAVGDAIPALVAWMQQHPDVAVAGPLLRYPDGNIQSSRRRFPTLGVFFFESTPLEWRWPNNRWVRQYRMLDLPDNEQPVDWLVGAALLVRAKAIQQAGLFDERFTLYSEELEWQRRLGKAGTIMYVPSATIIHHEGQSSAQIPMRRLVLFHRNRLRYIRLVHGAGLALLVRLFLIMIYLFETVLEGVKWLVGHKRAMRGERVRAYLGLVGALGSLPKHVSM